MEFAQRLSEYIAIGYKVILWMDDAPGINKLFNNNIIECKFLSQLVWKQIAAFETILFYLFLYEIFLQNNPIKML